jgi:hypothetical protein
VQLFINQAEGKFPTLDTHKGQQIGLENNIPSLHNQCSKVKHATMETKNCHILIIFDTYRTLIYHGACLESILYLKFTLNGGLHPNISLYHEIGTNMNKLISNWSTFSLCNSIVIVVQLYKRTTKDYI